MNRMITPGSQNDRRADPRHHRHDGGHRSPENSTWNPTDAKGRPNQRPLNHADDRYALQGARVTEVNFSNMPLLVFGLSGR